MLLHKSISMGDTEAAVRRLFRRRVLSSPNVVLHIGELAYGNRPFEVTRSDDPNAVQLRTTSEMWHKENVLNRVVQNFPAEWRFMELLGRRACIRLGTTGQLKLSTSCNIIRGCNCSQTTEQCMPFEPTTGPSVCAPALHITM